MATTCIYWNYVIDLGAGLPVADGAGWLLS
jgi:hypothetical protein